VDQNLNIFRGFIQKNSQNQESQPGNCPGGVAPPKSALEEARRMENYLEADVTLGFTAAALESYKTEATRLADQMLSVGERNPHENPYCMGAGCADPRCDLRAMLPPKRRGLPGACDLREKAPSIEDYQREVEVRCLEAAMVSEKIDHATGMSQAAQFEEMREQVLRLTARVFELEVLVHKDQISVPSIYRHGDVNSPHQAEPAVDLVYPGAAGGTVASDDHVALVRKALVDSLLGPVDTTPLANNVCNHSIENEANTLTVVGWRTGRARCDVCHAEIFV
jgi:hypothetical protein